MSKSGAALRAAGWVTVGAIAAGGVATAATTSSDRSGKTSAVTTTATAPAPATTPAKAGKRAGKGLAAKLKGRLLHGEAVVLGKDNKPITVAEQRGTVDAVSPTSISLTSKDGFKQTYVVGATTRVRIDGKKGAIGDVKVGQTAGVLATVDGSTQTARAIIERAAK